MPKSNKLKLHKLDQSFFYNLNSRNKLANVFGLTEKKLIKISNMKNSYRIFQIKKETNKKRQIEVPKKQLLSIHAIAFKLLRKIRTPEYLHSGVKKKSYITNAKVHLNSKRLLTLDIKKFYPSTKQYHIYNYFYNVMCCSQDVSAILARLFVYDNHVPTGSCLSQKIAFYAHYEMFNEIYMLAKSHNLKMTCFVDDITISGDQVNSKLLYQVRGILHKCGLKSHPKKESLFLNSKPRKVTGAMVTEDGLKLPNYKHKEIRDDYLSIPRKLDNREKMKFIKSLIGKVISASQIDYSMNKILRPLLEEYNRLSGHDFKNVN